MKFGINTFLWTAEFKEDNFHLLPVIRSHGFDGVEVSLFRPAGFPAAKIRRALADERLECTVCSVLPRGVSLISEDRNVRGEAVSHLKACIESTAEAGARIIAGPLYAPVGYLPGRRRTADEWQAAVEGYQQLGDVLSRLDVQLCIEPLNRFETFFLNTTADAVRLCQEVNHPNVGILWDSFHANIEEKDPPAALQQAGPHLKHVHTCENDRGTPGSGHVDWRSLFVVLKNLNYSGWLTIESFGFALGDLSSAASIWRDLEQNCEDIAWRGIEFLKRAAAVQADGAA
ncbi:MAG: sugar phosphate isomerase/epimerase [Acidobacteriaceae bacterium]|nr:sugar phosphate isomerase/epimerase [Acidobacteriaceae bacterium]